jgi:hypothetical protein
MDRVAYLNGLIGRAWSPVRHCWSLVREVEHDLFGRDLPAMPAGLATSGLHAITDTFGGHAERANWREVTAPSDGAIALIARKSADIHCGVYLDRPHPGILHCDEAQGVCFDPLVILKMTWGRIRYFEHI